jgi:glycosyltransferase involved in cell wall biosynthesis
MTAPTLSVVVPNYNHGSSLSACLKAILGQSHRPDEVIVVDDGSTDNSLEILDQLRLEHENLRVLKNDKNRGVVYTVNRGIDAASGDFLFFPGADDEIKPGLFEKSMRLLAEHPEAGLSCTISEWHDLDSGLKWHMSAGMAQRPCYLSPPELVKLGRQGKLIVCTSSAIFRKEPLCRAGRFLAELKWHSDWYAATVTSFRHGLCFVPEPLSDFVLDSKSYYHRGRGSEEHHHVLKDLLNHLVSPECADIRAEIRDSAILSVFGAPLLRLLLAQSRYRGLLTFRLVRRTGTRVMELIGKEILPKPIARLCLWLLYRRREPGKAR